MKALKNIIRLYVGGISEINNESKNISQEIFNFIQKFHQTYNEYLDVEKLIKYMEAEKTGIIDICKYFIDLIFVDGDIFTLNLEKSDEKNKDGLDIDEESYFENEEINLTQKLKKLNFNENDADNNTIFEDEETLKEYAKINYEKKFRR